MRLARREAVDITAVRQGEERSQCHFDRASERPTPKTAPCHNNESMPYAYQIN